MKKVTRVSVIKSLNGESVRLKEFGVKKIGLFGSVLKGKQNDKSDVDILISFDNYMVVYYFLQKLIKRKIDLVIESDLKPELQYVKKETEYVKI